MSYITFSDLYLFLYDVIFSKKKKIELDAKYVLHWKNRGQN
jgi:hypothetical protein